MGIIVSFVSLFTFCFKLLKISFLIGNNKIFLNLFQNYFCISFLYSNLAETNTASDENHRFGENNKSEKVR